MTMPIEFSGEEQSNAARQVIARQEPVSLRTYTPTQAVLAKSAGTFHWTPEGRRLYDYSSGVLVANLGHNPRRWMQRFAAYMGWQPDYLFSPPSEADVPSVSPPDQGGAGGGNPATSDDPTASARSTPPGPPLSRGGEYFAAVSLTAYNAVTEIEAAAVRRLVKNLQSFPGGGRLDTVMWAASGSEAIQKALWAALRREEGRDMMIATRYGFHGKKGLAGAVTGSEKDRDRDPRVRFISFPMAEVDDISRYGQEIDLTKYQAELDALWSEYGRRLTCLITEPYLGGGGSYHPPAAYMQLLERFCREHDILLIFDEVQSNFGRTGCLYAFEKYGVEPDIVCLGKGLGNGVPVSAAVGRGDVFGCLTYGETSDTWSANPLACAAVLATLDEFETTDVMNHARRISRMFFEGLERLKQTGLIAKVRGEGMVFGIECAEVAGRPSGEVANAIVEACYLGQGDDGIHLLGPLAGNVIRVSPPLTITEPEARDSLDLLYEVASQLGQEICGSAVTA